MAYIYKTKDKNGKEHPRWKIQYTDYRGKRVTKAGYTSIKETEKLARSLEDQQRRIRDGLDAPPGSLQANKRRACEEVISEYFAWAESQGWNKRHLATRRTQLAWWKTQLNLIVQSDLEGVLPRAEKALRDLAGGNGADEGSKGRSIKTVTHYANCLSAFCAWCVERKYLPSHPLRGLKLPRASVSSTRRALALDEITRLLEVSPPERRVLYTVALATGLRANELRSLTVHDFDLKNGGLHLRPEWTKNGKAGFQHLSACDLEEIQAFIKSGCAKLCYEHAHHDKVTRQFFPVEPLLYVPKHTAHNIRKDLKAAKIPEVTPEGKVDFHALRTTYVTLLFDTGANPKEIQHLARHSTLALTMDTYARIREKRLPDIASALSRLIRDRPPHEDGEKPNITGA